MFQVPTPDQVQWAGPLGAALTANHDGRLLHFIDAPSSPAIVLFSPEVAAKNVSGDWYGEHAGKWLYAASRAAFRLHDPVLEKNVRTVADYLVHVQQPDGYLGTYAPERRFDQKEAIGKRTWDIWVESYLILGLLEVNKYFPDPHYKQAAQRIGDLCLATLTEKKFNITDLGNHFGLSATVLLDPMAELYLATGDNRYLEGARLILQQADHRPEVELLKRALAGADIATIGDGKAYQLCWNYVGLAKLYHATGDAQYLQALEKVWTSLHDYHLTLGGGPWGGVHLSSRELFNPAAVFSPEGYVETCSTMSWIQLNRELLAATGNARYAEEIETTAYNDLLSAAAPDGENWCYYSFPNGERIQTTYWRCCKSSGAVAVEELPSLAYSVVGRSGIAVNIYGPNEARLELDGSKIHISQETQYPFAGRVNLSVTPDHAGEFSLYLRIPSWTKAATMQVNSEAAAPTGAAKNGYIQISRRWNPGDRVTINFPMLPQLVFRDNRSVQEAVLPDGKSTAQEVFREDFVAVKYGPLAYATTLVDGFKSSETIRLPQNPQSALSVDSNGSDPSSPKVTLTLGYRAPLVFTPLYQAGGRENGSWHITWLRLASRDLHANN